MHVLCLALFFSYETHFLGQMIFKRTLCNLDFELATFKVPKVYYAMCDQSVGVIETAHTLVQYVIYPSRSPHTWSWIGLFEELGIHQVRRLFRKRGRKSLSTGPYCTAVLVINRLSRSAWRLSFGVTADVWCSIIIVILSPPHMRSPYGYCKSGCVCVCCLPFCPAHVKPIMSCSKLISRSQKRSTIFNTSLNFKSIVQQKLRIDCDVSWSNHQSNGQRCEIGLDADLIMTVFWVEFHHSSDYCWLNGVESLSKVVQKLLDMFKYRQIAKKHLLEPSP